MTDVLKLLAIFPHPDDETVGLGSTLIRYGAEGVQTYLVCATRGERGWFDSEGSDPGLSEVGRIREAELRCAAGHLGLHEVSFLDYVDGDLDQSDPEEIIGRMVAHIRRIRPQVVVTFGPDGTYGHPDHIALSQFTAGALICAADQSFSSSGGPPHRVAKFYYMVDSEEVVRLVQQELGGISMEIDGVRRTHTGWADWQITTALDNRRHMEPLQKAILCHRSQLPGFGSLAEWSAADLARLFGMGYFYRAFSLVNGGRNVESDLFEGLR